MKNNKFDVIIIGAGPAGSMLAYELAKNKIKVCVLEKEKLPRYKVCGGGVTANTFKIIPFDISEVVEDITYKITFTYKFKNRFTRESQKPLIYMVMRNKFDYFLAKKAVKKGAKLINEKAIQIKNLKDRVKVKTDKRELEAKILVGAEGAVSLTAKYVGVDNRFRSDIALESEVKTNKSTVKTHKNHVIIDWGTIPGSYAWVFPKANVLSIGVGGPSKLGKIMMPLQSKWLKINKIKDAKACGHIIKFNIDQKINVVKNRLVLIGEAAGFVDAFSGEGMHFAIKSAQIAAPIITEAVKKNNIKVLKKYQDITKEIVEEIKLSNNALVIFNAFPKTCHNLLKKYDRLWNYYCKVITGERTYKNIENHPKVKNLWPVLLFVSKIIYKVRLQAAYRKGG